MAHSSFCARQGWGGGGSSVHDSKTLRDMVRHLFGQLNRHHGVKCAIYRGSTNTYITKRSGGGSLGSLQVLSGERIISICTLEKNHGD